MFLVDVAPEYKSVLFVTGSTTVDGVASSLSALYRFVSNINDTGWSLLRFVPISLVSPVYLPPPTGMVSPGPVPVSGIALVPAEEYPPEPGAL